MSKDYANVNPLTGTFAGWLSKANELFYDMETIIVTASPVAVANITNQSTTTGLVGGAKSLGATANSYLNGTFSSNELVVKTALRGGTVTTSFANSQTLLITSNTHWNDNNILLIGDGSDLQIYHDGSNSYITDNGMGNLKVSSSQIDFLGAGAETMATMIDNGAVTLYHDNLVKIATTATGVNVTGLTDTDTLIVGGGYGSTGLDIAATGNIQTNGTLTVDGLASLNAGIAVDTDKFTVADTSGNVSTAGTLGVTGISTLGIINASGLASLDAGIDVDGAFTVADTSGNVVTSGTLGVTGVSTLGVINASGLASLDAGIDVDGAFTVADTSGNIATSGTLGVTGISTLGVINASGLASLNGGIAVDANFTVSGSTGATVIGSTLTVTGESSLDGGLRVDDSFIVSGSTGAISTTSTLTVTGAAVLNGGLTMDTNKFTVADTSGNVTAAGTVVVTNATTSTSTTSGALKVTGGVGIAENLNVGGNADISGNLVVDGDTTISGTGTLTVASATFTTLDTTGNTTIGSNGDDTVAINAVVSTNIKPNANNTLDLGSSLLKWQHVYANGNFITSLNASNISSGTIAADLVATLNQNTTGSAATLTTPRNIGGVSFNGSAAIDLPGVNVAGNQNTTGSAATVTTAAQPNITSVGTLTALQVDNININGNAITSTAGVDLAITPLAGQQIVLDGTIVIDAGVITGATSITSTSFVGNITGNAGTVTNGVYTTGNQTIAGDKTFSGTTDFNGVVTLDGATSSSSSFIVDGGYMRFNDSVELNLGSGDDVEIYHDGTNLYADINAGNFYIRDGTDGNATALSFVPTNGSLALYNNDGGVAGPNLTLRHNSASPAASDNIGQILFQADNAAGENHNYAYIDARIIDPTTDSEDGSLTLYTIDAGTSKQTIRAESGIAYLYNGGSAKLTTASDGVTINGTAVATDFNTTSDINLKENLEIIENPIEKVKALNGYTFNFKDEPNRRVAGVIAQEVEEVLPEVVSQMTTENGTSVKTVSYGNMVALLLEAVKEQQKQIDELRILLTK